MPLVSRLLAHHGWPRFGIREGREREEAGDCPAQQQTLANGHPGIVCVRLNLNHFGFLYFIAHRTTLTKVSATRLLRFQMIDVLIRPTLHLFFKLLKKG